MNLRAQFVISIGLLGLLCLVLPGSLRADDFTFSFTDTMATIGNVHGTVTGKILGLTNNSTGPATAVILDSYPAALSVNPFLAATPITVTTIPWIVAKNQFTEHLGVITQYDFDASIDDTTLGVYAALQMYHYSDPVTRTTLNGSALTECTDAVQFTRDIIPAGYNQTPFNRYCLFVQNERTDGGPVVTFAPIVSAVPEPGTADLMLLGIGLVFVMRKRIVQGLHQAT